MVLIVLGPTPQGGVPLCVGGFGGGFVLAEAAKQVRLTLRLTSLIPACKTELMWTLLLIMPPNISHHPTA
jgi:hypothetical protein